MRILLTGIAGRLGRRVAQRLVRMHDVVGIDHRPAPGLPKEIEIRHDDADRLDADMKFMR